MTKIYIEGNPDTSISSTSNELNDVYRRKKLTTDSFLKTGMVVTISISRRKNTLAIFSGGHIFKGPDNKIMGFVHI